MPKNIAKADKKWEHFLPALYGVKDGTFACATYPLDSPQDCRLFAGQKATFTKVGSIFKSLFLLQKPRRDFLGGVLWCEGWDLNPHG